MTTENAREAGKMLVALDQMVAVNGVLVALRSALVDAIQGGEVDGGTLEATREEMRRWLRIVEESAEVVRVLVADMENRGVRHGE